MRRASAPALLRTLVGGGSVALVSDAGTPLISDPGYKLVSEAVSAGVRVTGCPGPSAPLLALILSGLPTDRFYFGGFLPSKAGPRREALATLCSLDATLVFLESPWRLAASLEDMAATLGPRPAAVARELTKLHEEVRRGNARRAGQPLHRRRRAQGRGRDRRWRRARRHGATGALGRGYRRASRPSSRRRHRARRGGSAQR